MSTLDLYRQSCEDNGLPLEVPYTPQCIIWFRQQKGGPMVFTHFWRVMPEHLSACYAAAEARHLFVTHTHHLPAGYERVDFDPAARIPYRHYPAKDIA